MSERISGMLIGLLLIGGAFLLFNNKNEKVIGDKNVSQTTVTCEPGNCGPRCGDQAKTPLELLNSRIKCGNDPECVEPQADPCPQEITFENFRSGQRLLAIKQRVALYDHLGTFLKKYKSLACDEDNKPCVDMYTREAFLVPGYSDDGSVYSFIEAYDKLLDETEPYSIGDTAGQVEYFKTPFVPIIDDMTLLYERNLFSYEAFLTDLIPIVHGLQYNIKYALLEANGGMQIDLPRDFKSRARY